jgi:integrase
LNVAQEHGIIASNPAEKARPPKIEDRHERIFSKEEALKFLDAIKGHPLEGAFLIELISRGKVRRNRRLLLTRRRKARNPSKLKW